ncbi:hypothetical protein RN001_007620 [Aquatica leii]|uniref:Uncharacterized protein n=1 Tax=Aquatica leii TaxID=1421715 RepID=A0AAN7P906_9COLE|nr:hypothetical protein RN001_007620 [Aquatica leii]
MRYLPGLDEERENEEVEKEEVELPDTEENREADMNENELDDPEPKNQFNRRIGKNNNNRTKDCKKSSTITTAQIRQLDCNALLVISDRSRWMVRSTRKKCRPEISSNCRISAKSVNSAEKLNLTSWMAVLIESELVLCKSLPQKEEEL